MSRIMSTIYTNDDFCWPIAESPNEVRAKLKLAEAAGESLVEFKIGNHLHEKEVCVWNGRTVWLRASAIVAVAPPLREDEDE